MTSQSAESKVCSITDIHEFNFGEFGCFHVFITCVIAVTRNMLKRCLSDNFIVSRRLIHILQFQRFF